MSHSITSVFGLSRRDPYGAVFGLLLLFSFLFISCKDIRKEFYPNGELKQKLSYKNDVLDGPSVWFFQNGKKMMECTYKDGKIEGKVTHWSFGGNPESEGFYVNNLRNGKCIQYYEGGGIAMEQNYKNDTLDGAFVEYYPDKEIKTKGAYNMGMWDGKWDYYDDKGVLVGEGNFVKGRGILKGYYLNGHVKREVHYVNNQKDGSETWYKENGLFEKELVFKMDKLVN
jgi:antitoxin component YwqK of YwqJK toxin-antitoxin module